VVRLASRIITSFPKKLSAAPRLMAVVVFPTPPFPEVIVINFAIFYICIFAECHIDTSIKEII
jgi:hypothetical protein